MTLIRFSDVAIENMGYGNSKKLSYSSDPVLTLN